MNKFQIAKEIGFADSEFLSFQLSENAELTVLLNSWQNKTIRICFVHAIQFSYKLGDVVEGVYQLSNSSFFEDALSQNYEKIPSNHPFKMFQIMDIADFPFIEVVAEAIHVNKD